MQLQLLIDQLQADVIHSPSELNANLDKLAVAGVIRNRQQMANTQMQSAIVNQMVAQQKGRRDAEAEQMNATIEMLRDKGEISQSLTAGSGAVLRNWRLQ